MPFLSVCPSKHSYTHSENISRLKLGLILGTFQHMIDYPKSSNFCRKPTDFYSLLSLNQVFKVLLAIKVHINKFSQYFPNTIYVNVCYVILNEFKKIFTSGTYVELIFLVCVD